jgi:hypothetical protein
MVTSDGDSFMHWRMGEQMLQTRSLIRHDIFSHTAASGSFIAVSWLTDIIFGIAGRIAGLAGISVVAAVLIATIFALLHWQLLRDGNDMLVATGIALLAAWAASIHWLARPHLFTVLLALLWNSELRRFDGTGHARRLFVVAPVLMLLWVNLHAGFVFGFVILGAYWVGAVVEKDRVKLKTLTGVFIVAAVISLVNPNGIRLHLSIVEFLRSDYLRGWFSEYASTNFHAPSSRGFLAWLAMLFLALSLCRPRLSVSSAILLFFWTYSALYAARNIPMLAVLTAPIVAPAITGSLPGFWKKYAERFHTIRAGCGGWAVVVAVAGAAVIGFSQPVKPPASDWPVDAVDYIQRHPDKFTGNMFNQFIWGGYLMQALPEHKVFVDGRADFYGKNLLRNYSDTTGLKTNWGDALVNYDVRWTLLPGDHRLNLALDGVGWNKVYSDSTAVIYRRPE